MVLHVVLVHIIIGCLGMGPTAWRLVPRVSERNNMSESHIANAIFDGLSAALEAHGAEMGAASSRLLNYDEDVVSSKFREILLNEKTSRRFRALDAFMKFHGLHRELGH